MAKMFYTLDETKVALGQSEDQIKQLTREGRLREFRDGPRLMFKSDQVDALRAQIGGDSIGLAEESGAPLSLADTGGGSRSGLNLADSIGSGLASSGSGLAGISGSGLGSGLTGGAGSGMMNLKEDTALAADLGLSGTVGGIPSPGRSGSAGGSMSGSGGSRQGINVFGDDTHAPADPMAQTAMPGAGVGSVADLNLEGVGSGSGLLDLTRESDDTSLGAEILDEMSPGGTKRPLAPPDTGSMTGVRLDAPRGGGIVRGTTGIVYVEKPDKSIGAFGGAALGAGFVVLFALFVLCCGIFDVHPDVITYFKEKSFAFVAVASLAVAVLFGIFGGLISMSLGR